MKSGFVYLRVDDATPDPLTPLTIYVELNDAQFEVRKISVLPNGQTHLADESTPDTFAYALGWYPYSEESWARTSSQFSKQKISAEEFDRLWIAARDHRGPSSE